MTPSTTILPPRTCICGDTNCTIPYGLCHCGCGGESPSAKQTNANKNMSNGLPVRFIKGHDKRRPHPTIPEGLCICLDLECKIPFGLCHCGCGKSVSVYTRDRVDRGERKGFPCKYLLGHAMTGTVNSPETIEKRRDSLRENMRNPEIRRKRIAQVLATGFRPFLTREWHYQPKTKEYRKFRAQAWERDGNACTSCGATEKLCIHHIISRTERPDLRFDLGNVITLCWKCHAKEEATLKHERNRREKAMDFAAFCPYVNRLDLLARVVSSTADAGIKLHVINNSGDSHLELHPALIINPPVPLSFTQSMNFEFLLTEEFGKKFCLHMHSDAIVTPASIKALLEKAREIDASGKKWGVIFSLYDIMAIYNPVAAKDVGGYDTNFSAYFSDNDYYRRLQLAGWELVESGITVGHGVDGAGSQTINSDPYLKYVNGITFPLYRAYYAAKWAGEPGKEHFDVPFGGHRG